MGATFQERSRGMKAVVQDRYGPPEVLRVDDIEQPVPNDDEVLIRIRATTVSQSDTHLRAANPFFWRLIAGLRRPRWRTLGVELAGEVEAVGAAVTEFKVGNHVFGQPPLERGGAVDTTLLYRVREAGPKTGLFGPPATGSSLGPRDRAEKGREKGHQAASLSPFHGPSAGRPVDLDGDHPGGGHGDADDVVKAEGRAI
jgi:Alcohol dehydrogenase GroES-like domain